MSPKAVLRALSPGNGRANRCPRDELPERLAADGVNFDPDALPEVLVRLEDVGQLQRVQRQPFSVYPQFLVQCGDQPYDETDGLAADICASIKRRGEQFESDDQLVQWLTEDGAHFDPDSLSVALRQLQRLGRIKRAQLWSTKSKRLPAATAYLAPMHHAKLRRGGARSLMLTRGDSVGGQVT